MTCVGGGMIPEWMPDWLVPWVVHSQGITICGVEYLMLLEGVIVLAVLIYFLGVADAHRSA